MMRVFCFGVVFFKIKQSLFLGLKKDVTHFIFLINFNIMYQNKS